MIWISREIINAIWLRKWSFFFFDEQRQQLKLLFFTGESEEKKKSKTSLSLSNGSSRFQGLIDFLDPQQQPVKIYLLNTASNANFYLEAIMSNIFRAMSDPAKKWNPKNIIEGYVFCFSEDTMFFILYETHIKSNQVYDSEYDDSYL